MQDKGQRLLEALTLILWSPAGNVGATMSGLTCRMPVIPRSSWSRMWRSYATPRFIATTQGRNSAIRRPKNKRGDSRWAGWLGSPHPSGSASLLPFP